MILWTANFLWPALLTSILSYKMKQKKIGKKKKNGMVIVISIGKLTPVFWWLKNVGGHFETWNTGILGPVALHGLDQGKWDLSWQKWTYQVVELTSLSLMSLLLIQISFIMIHECLFEQVGLKGEAMNLVSPNGISSVEWMEGSLAAQKQQPLRWHKVNKNEK